MFSLSMSENLLTFILLVGWKVVWPYVQVWLVFRFSIDCAAFAIFWQIIKRLYLLRDHRKFFSKIVKRSDLLSPTIRIFCAWKLNDRGWLIDTGEYNELLYCSSFLMSRDFWVEFLCRDMWEGFAATFQSSMSTVYSSSLWII